MYDVVALGELLIDFTPAGKSAGGMNVFEQNPGGAPANVLTALANLGRRTAFIGKVGADMHGDLLIETLKTKGIDTAGVLRDDSVFTTLAFVSLTAAGERNFSFARKPGADTRLRADELPRDMLAAAKIFHFGSLSLTDEPARAATFEAARIAGAAGAVISYDPNYRPPLWSGEETAARLMRRALPLSDIVKVSEEELALLTGETDIAAGVRHLFGQGAHLAAVTRGKDGAAAFTPRFRAECPAFAVPVADTTGAGDAFWGGFLNKLLEYGVKPENISQAQLEGALLEGSAAAALCVQKRGGIPAMPEKAELAAFLARTQPDRAGA